MNLKAEITNVQRAFGLVFAEKKYYLITILIAFAILAFLNFAVNFDFIINTLNSEYDLSKKIYIFIGLFEGILTTNTEITLISTSLVGILAGINTSFIIFKFRREKSLSKETGILGAFGALVGIFAGGCASCALSIAALLGVTGILGFLPFQGIELTILGIIILAIAISWSAKSVLGICNVEIAK